MILRPMTKTSYTQRGSRFFPSDIYSMPTAIVSREDWRDWRTRLASEVDKYGEPCLDAHDLDDLDRGYEAYLNATIAISEKDPKGFAIMLANVGLQKTDLDDPIMFNSALRETTYLNVVKNRPDLTLANIRQWLGAIFRKDGLCKSKHFEDQVDRVLSTTALSLYRMAHPGLHQITRLMAERVFRSQRPALALEVLHYQQLFQPCKANVEKGFHFASRINCTPWYSPVRGTELFMAHEYFAEVGLQPEERLPFLNGRSVSDIKSELIELAGHEFRGSSWIAEASTVAMLARATRVEDAIAASTQLRRTMELAGQYSPFADVRLTMAECLMHLNWPRGGAEHAYLAIQKYWAAEAIAKNSGIPLPFGIYRQGYLKIIRKLQDIPALQVFLMSVNRVYEYGVRIGSNHEAARPRAVLRGSALVPNLW